jgi:hypothetical protein
MTYLTIARLAGDPPALLETYRRQAERMDPVGRDHGLILHAGAQTPDGFLIVNLWPGQDGSKAAAADPRRLAALREAGLTPAQLRKEHYEVERYVLFAGSPGSPRGTQFSSSPGTSGA